MFEFLKRYQSGGPINQYSMSGVGDENLLMKELLTKLQGYGLNIDPTNPFASQMGEGGFGGKDVEGILRGQFGLPKKVLTDPKMFGTISQDQFKATQPGFYHGLYEETQDTLLDQMLKTMKQTQSTGFAGSGVQEDKKEQAYTDYTKGLESQKIKEDELMSGAYEDIFSEMQDWDDRMIDIKYG